MEIIEKVLIFVMILTILSLPVSAKYFGTTEIPKLVEQDGYCKITFGENWDFSELNEYCFNGSNSTERVNFTMEEFRKVCPRVNFFEPRFNSDCFYRGDSR